MQERSLFDLSRLPANELEPFTAVALVRNETGVIGRQPLDSLPSLLVRMAYAVSQGSAADVLRSLSTDDWTIVREGVALNPNASLDILKVLARDTSVHVRTAALISLMAHRGGDAVRLIESFAEDARPQVRHAFVMLLNCQSRARVAAAHLERLGEFIGNDIAERILSYTRWPRVYTPAEWQMSEDVWRNISQLQGEWAKARIRQLAEKRCELAATADYLERLSHDSSNDVRKAVAENACTPPVVKRAFVQDSFYWTRIAAGYDLQAGELLTPWDVETALVLAPLAFEPRHAQAQNTLCTKMLQCSTLEMRVALAHKFKPSPDMVVQLANDDCESVRECMASRQGIPATVREALASDPDVDVRENAAWYAYNSSSVLNILKYDASAQVRMAVARTEVERNQQAMYGEVLEALGDDDNPDVRRAVAENSATPRDTVNKLCEDTVDWVKKVAIHVRDHPIVDAEEDEEGMAGLENLQWQ